MNYSRTILIQAFPPEMGFRGAETQIYDLSHYRLPPWFSRIQAVHVCTQRNLESVPVGGGHKAQRRAARNSQEKLAEFAQLRSHLE